MLRYNDYSTFVLMYKYPVPTYLPTYLPTNKVNMLLRHKVVLMLLYVGNVMVKSLFNIFVLMLKYPVPIYLHTQRIQYQHQSDQSKANAILSWLAF